MLIIKPPSPLTTLHITDTMSSLPRTIKGFLSMGPARFMRQLNNIGDTKVGTLVGTDKFGNKYFENLNESYGTEDTSQLATHLYIHSLCFTMESMLLSCCFLCRQYTSGHYYSIITQGRSPVYAGSKFRKTAMSRCQGGQKAPKGGTYEPGTRQGDCL